MIFPPSLSRKRLRRGNPRMREPMRPWRTESHPLRHFSSHIEKCAGIKRKERFQNRVCTRPVGQGKTRSRAFLRKVRATNGSWLTSKIVDRRTSPSGKVPRTIGRAPLLSLRQFGHATNLAQPGPDIAAIADQAEKTALWLRWMRDAACSCPFEVRECPKPPYLLTKSFPRSRRTI